MVFEKPDREVGGWESLESAGGRVWSFLRDVVASGPLPAAVVSHGLVLSAVRAKLLGHDGPSPEEWRGLPFGGVAKVDASGWRLVEDFAVCEREQGGSHG